MPLLFSSYTTSPTEKLFRIWPFVFMGTYKEGGGQASILPLFWWSKKQRPRLVHRAAPPLRRTARRQQRHHRSRRQAHRLLPPPRRQRHLARPVPAPLRARDREARSFVGPFMWFRNDRTATTPASSSRSGGRSTTRSTGYDHKLLLPLFDYESEQRGHKQRVVVARSANGSATIRAASISCSSTRRSIFHRSDTKRTVDVVPPLFTRWNTKDGGGGGFIAGPVVHSHDPNGSTTSCSRSTGASTIAARRHHAHPGAVRRVPSSHRRARRLRRAVLRWSSSNGEGAGAPASRPSSCSGTTGRAITRWCCLCSRAGPTRAPAPRPPPSARSSGTPLPTAGDGGLFPILFAGRHKHASYAVVPGLVYCTRATSTGHRRRRPASTSRAARTAGPPASRRSPSSAATARARTKSSSRSCSHFADTAARTDNLLVGPFYPRARGRARPTDALFPLFYVRRSPTSGFGIWPVGGWQKNAGVETTVVGPFIHQSNERTHSRTSMLFPLLTLHDSPQLLGARALPVSSGASATATRPTPRSSRSTSAAARPITAGTASSRSSSTRRTSRRPRRWSARSGTARAPTAARPPACSRCSRGARRSHDGKSSSWFGMPGVYADNNQFLGTSHTWVLDFFHFARPDGYTAGLIPLAFAWRRGTASRS